MSELPQPTTTLVFSVDNPCNTIISDKTSGRTLYTVETHRVNGSVTSDVKITTYVYDWERSLIATLRWKDIISDVVTIPSKELVEKPLSKWLKKSINPFKQTSTFEDHVGRKYKWDTKGLRSQFRLMAPDASKDIPIAYFERAQPYGTSENPQPTPSMFHLTSRAEEIRDDVVLSFLFMEKERRRETHLTAKFAEREVLSSGGGMTSI